MLYYFSMCFFHGTFDMLLQYVFDTLAIYICNKLLLFCFSMCFSLSCSFCGQYILPKISHILSLDLLMLFFHIQVQLSCLALQPFFFYSNVIVVSAIISIIGVTNCFPSSHVNLKVDKLLFAVFLRIVLAFVRTVSKMNANAFVVQRFDFIRTQNFEEIKSTISTPPFL